MGAQPSTAIVVAPTSVGQRGQRYRVLHDGSVLIENAREPLLEACRALLAKGITGRIEMWRAGTANYDMAVDIEGGARLTVAESADCGPTIREWRPWADDADEHAFPAVRSEQGEAFDARPLGRWPRKNRPSTALTAA